MHRIEALQTKILSHNFETWYAMGGLEAPTRLDFWDLSDVLWSSINAPAAKVNTICITASGSRNHQLLAAMKKRRKSPNLPQDEGAPPLFLGALSE
jgi:hypothetical protein